MTKKKMIVFAVVLLMFSVTASAWAAQTPKYKPM
jgi:hypothetical protein